jgi:hypothetical protein
MKSILFFSVINPFHVSESNTNPNKRAFDETNDNDNSSNNSSSSRPTMKKSKQKDIIA